MRRYPMGFVWGSLTTVVTSGTYLYVALQAIAGQLTLGDLTFYSPGGRLGHSLQRLLSGLSDMYENSLYLANLFEFLDYHRHTERARTAARWNCLCKKGWSFATSASPIRARTRPPCAT